ncbi:MAG: zinc ABC transporter substrate-binding protein [Thermoplasmata archaeon]|nr:zinc ABC transporter substrate-binding protein [Thermoplasmata archaeon]
MSSNLPTAGPADDTVPTPSGGRARRPASPRWALPLVLVLVLVVSGGLVAVHYYAKPTSTHAAGGVLQVVAAENFWGSLVVQLGGSHVSVFSIVSDPNADPHDYESSTADAVAIANAQLVIENGAGYDDWCQHLLSASNTPNQVVLNVANVLGKVAGDNPHFWYGATYVNATLASMYGDLVKLDGADRAYFEAQYTALNTSLNSDVFGREAEIRTQFAGTQVASTESIFQYMANSSGLDLVSPPAFMDAVAEGNDPPIASVTLFQNQLESGNVSVLVYNEQTVTPLTTQMKQIATDHNVSVVGVTETIQPTDVTFEVWMEGELLALQNALNQKALGK